MQIVPREAPRERCGDGRVSILKGEYRARELMSGCEVIGREHLSLNDGEIDFDLIQPACMNRRVHKDQIRPHLAKTLTRRHTAMRGAVVDDPEDAVSGPIRLPLHHVLDESLERLRSIARIADAEHLGLMNIERREISQCSGAFVTMLDSTGAVSPWRRSLVDSMSRLNTGLLVG